LRPKLKVEWGVRRATLQEAAPATFGRIESIDFQNHIAFLNRRPFNNCKILHRHHQSTISVIL